MNNRKKDRKKEKTGIKKKKKTEDALSFSSPKRETRHAP